jgi:hypothetical protein
MSKRYKFIALVNSKDGQDEAFNSWHTDTHLPEVVRAAGFLRGERLKIVAGSNGDNTLYRYLVLFEGEGDPTEALTKLGAAMAAGNIHMTDALGGPLWASMYEPIAGAEFVA